MWNRFNFIAALPTLIANIFKAEQKGNAFILFFFLVFRLFFLLFDPPSIDGEPLCQAQRQLQLSSDYSVPSKTGV